jgi:hypothetical protein
MSEIKILKVLIDLKRIKLTNDPDEIGSDLFSLPKNIIGYQCESLIGDFKLEISIKKNNIFIRKKKINIDDEFIGLDEIVYTYSQLNNQTTSKFATIGFVSNIKNKDILKNKRLSKEDVLFYLFNFQKDFFIKNIFNGFNFYSYCMGMDICNVSEVSLTRNQLESAFLNGLSLREPIKISVRDIYKSNLLHNSSVLKFEKDFKSYHLKLTPFGNKLNKSVFCKEIKSISFKNLSSDLLYVSEIVLTEHNLTETKYSSLVFSDTNMTSITPSDYTVINSKYERKVLNKNDYFLMISPKHNKHPYTVEKIHMPMIVECFGYPSYISIDKGVVSECYREHPFNIRREFRGVVAKVKGELSGDYYSCFHFLCLGKNRKYSSSIMKFFTESKDFELEDVDSDIVELFFINGERGEEVYRLYKKAKFFYEALLLLIQDNKNKLETVSFRRKAKELVNNYNWKI